MRSPKRCWYFVSNGKTKDWAALASLTNHSKACDASALEGETLISLSSNKNLRMVSSKVAFGGAVGGFVGGAVGLLLGGDVVGEVGDVGEVGETGAFEAAVPEEPTVSPSCPLRKKYVMTPVAMMTTSINNSAIIAADLVLRDCHFCLESS